MFAEVVKVAFSGKASSSSLQAIPSEEGYCLGALETYLCFGLRGLDGGSISEAVAGGKMAAYQRVLRSIWPGSAATRFNHAETAG